MGIQPWEWWGLRRMHRHKPPRLCLSAPREAQRSVRHVTTGRRGPRITAPFNPFLSTLSFHDATDKQTDNSIRLLQQILKLRVEP